LAAPRPIGFVIEPGRVTESEQCLARHSKAQAALDALLRKCVSPPGEFNLSARPDRPTADLKLIPASQVRDLKVNYAQRTARWVWDGNVAPLSLYDLHLQRADGSARTAATAAEPPVQMEPKDWFAETRKTHPQRQRERPDDYAKRLRALMQVDPRVRKVWPLRTLKRRLYDTPE
jgi:hypothetical protein